MSASDDCWIGTFESNRISARLLQSHYDETAFARQLLASGFANRELMDKLRAAFVESENIPVSIAAEAWTKAVAWKPMR